MAAKTRLERNAKIFALVVIPLAVAIGPAAFNWTSKNEELSLEYMKLAVRILQTPQSEEQEHLREWATKIIEEYTPVSLGVDATSELEIFDFKPWYLDDLRIEKTPEID